MVLVTIVIRCSYDLTAFINGPLLIESINNYLRNFGKWITNTIIRVNDDDMIRVSDMRFELIN